MIETLRLLTFEQIGLILNLAGTLLVAFSFGENLEEAHQYDKKGRKVYLASFLHPNGFYVGIGLLGLGFLSQLIATMM